MTEHSQRQYCVHKRCYRQRDKGAIGAGGEAVGEKTEGGCGESVHVLLPPVAKLSVLRTARFRLRRRCDSKAGWW